MYGLAWCHVRVFMVCRFTSFCGVSIDTCVGDDCFVVGGFGRWEVILIDVFVPCFMNGLCGYNRGFG